MSANGRKQTFKLPAKKNVHKLKFIIMELSIRKRYRIIWIILIASFVIFSILAVQVSQYFFIPFVILIISLGIYSQFLRCPKCNKPVLFNPLMVDKPNRFLKNSDCFGTPWIPKNCTKCGEPII